MEDQTPSQENQPQTQEAPIASLNDNAAPQPVSNELPQSFPPVTAPMDQVLPEALQEVAPGAVPEILPGMLPTGEVFMPQQFLDPSQNPLLATNGAMIVIPHMPAMANNGISAGKKPLHSLGFLS